MKNGAYRCIDCGGMLIADQATLNCSACSSKFGTEGGIPILTRAGRYWCNFSADMMSRINDDAVKDGWKKALANNIKGSVAGHIDNEHRADFRYLLPLLKDKRVLDVGSMWGGVTVPISRHAKEVYAIDTTRQTLEFLSIRLVQEEINNVRIALASAENLPFDDDYFDIALMIGVLEWVGRRDDFIASEHYGKYKKDKPKNNVHPEVIQAKVLKELYRTLVPNGTAVVAIENRLFYKHFFGAPDPHTAVAFSSILPRTLADIYMRLLKNQRYAEYTYSYNSYKKMFRKAGFKSVSLYAAMPSYRELDVMVPLDDGAHIRYYYENYGLRGLKGLKKLVPQIILKLGLMKYFVPSYIILAEK